MDNELIAKIADEIVRRLTQETAHAPEPDTLVIVCDHVVRKGDVKAALWERFGGRVHVAALDGGYGSPEFEVNETGGGELVEMASRCGNVVFLSPRVNMLQNMAQGRDGGCMENIFFRSLLWGKKVHIMLDFSPPPKFKRNTFFQAIAQALDALVEMEVAVFTYDGKRPAGDGVSLVTENEVNEAYNKRNTRIVCQKGAIVTPAARDRARELNIEILF